MKITKKQIDHYWYYYKWHFFACIAVIIAITYTISSCMSIVHPDLVVAYVGPNKIDESVSAVFADKYSQHIKDINNDGKKTIFFEQIYISTASNPSGDMQMESGYRAKLLVELMSDRIKAYIINDELIGLFGDMTMFKVLDNGERFIPATKLVNEELNVLSGTYLSAFLDTPDTMNEEKQNEYQNANIFYESISR